MRTLKSLENRSGKPLLLYPYLSSHHPVTRTTHASMEKKATSERMRVWGMSLRRGLPPHRIGREAGGDMLVHHAALDTEGALGIIVVVVVAAAAGVMGEVIVAAMVVEVDGTAAGAAEMDEAV